MSVSKNIIWSLAGQSGKQVIMFVTAIWLVRLLEPHEFGLVAMITVFTGFANIFADIGLSSALIQKRDVGRNVYSSIFWVNIGLGTFLVLLFWLLAVPVSNFYREPGLVPIARVLSFGYLIGAVGIVQNTIFQKELRFREITQIEVLSTFLSCFLSVAAAYAGWGAWSIVVKMLTMLLFKTAFLWILAKWRPDFHFARKDVLSLMPFSSFLLVNESMNYWVRNIDNMLIGRFLGNGALGIYDNAYRIMLLPATNITAAFSSVLFPAFSLINDDNERIRATYLKASRVISLAAFPLMFGVIALADVFVQTVFGPAWTAMIPILMVLSLAGAKQSVYALVGNLYLAKGRTDLQLKVTFLLKLITVAGIVIGLHWGITGVAVGYTIAVFLVDYPNHYFAGKLVALNYWTILKNLAATFFCATTMAVAIFFLKMILQPYFTGWLVLGMCTAGGIILYCLTVYLFRIQAKKDLMEFINQKK